MDASLLSVTQPVVLSNLKNLSMAQSEKIDRSAKRTKLNPSKLGESSRSAARLMRKSMSSLDSFPMLATKMTLSPRNLSPPHQRQQVKLPGIDTKGKKLVNNGKAFRYKILPGNNSRCIMQSLKRRPWWHAILSADDDETLAQSQPTFIWEMYRNSARYKDDTYKYTLLSRIQRNACLVTKKGLYLSIKDYCAKKSIDMLTIIPRTFYLAPGNNSKSMKNDDLTEFEAFIASQQRECGISPEDIVWIMKPASKTNRGFGIKVVKGQSNVMKTVQRVSSASSTKSDNETEKEPQQGNEDLNNPLTKAARKIARQDGYIVQLYLHNPLLVDERKFDIRCFVLVTVFDPPRGKASQSANETQANGKQKQLTAYFFNTAYIRTSSKKYDMSKLHDRATHLTNDAVQKNVNNYGQFEQGNKLSLQEWQEFINKEYPSAGANIVMDQIFPAIKDMCKFSIAAAEEQLLNTNIQKSFELFGYDFMITQDYKPVLIEVNTNPCLEFVCPLLTDIISRVIDDTFKIVLDQQYVPNKAMRTKASEEAWQELQAESHSFLPLFP